MIENVVFDIGNVILKWDPLTYLVYKYTDYSDISTMLKLVFHSTYWNELDRGVLSYEEAARLMTSTDPTRYVEVMDILNNFEEYSLDPIKSTEYVIRTLKKKGYKLFVLSNYMSQIFEIALAKYEVFKLFDGMIVSSDHNLTKPDHAIYRKLLDEYKLTAGETIFIDDLEANVTAAKKVGIKAIEYSGYRSMVDLLATLNTQGLHG